MPSGAPAVLAEPVYWWNTRQAPLIHESIATHDPPACPGVPQQLLPIYDAAAEQFQLGNESGEEAWLPDTSPVAFPLFVAQFLFLDLAGRSLGQLRDLNGTRAHVTSQTLFGEVEDFLLGGILAVG